MEEAFLRIIATTTNLTNATNTTNTTNTTTTISSSTTSSVAVLSKTVGEYIHCVEAILILWMIGVILLWIVTIVKFIKSKQGIVIIPSSYTKSLNVLLFQEVSGFIRGLEEIIENAFPLFGIVFLNIVTLGSYVYATFATYFGVFLFVVLEIVEDKLPEKSRGVIKIGIPTFFIVSLFLNFWINNETYA